MWRAALLTLLALSLSSGACGDKREGRKSSDEGDTKESGEPDKSSGKSDGGLSRASRRIACEVLKQELTIDAYVTRDKVTEKAIQSIEALFKRYEQATFQPPGSKEELKSKVRARVIELKTDADKATAKAEGLTETMFSEPQGPSSALVMQGYLGFVVKYGSEREATPVWAADDPESLEFYLTGKMHELQGRAEKVVTRIGYVSGKDEIGPGDPNLMPYQPTNITQVFEQYFTQYKIEPVDLKGGDAAIDPELRALLITQPGKPYTDKELRRVDEFVMRGGKGLMVVASAVNLAVGDTTMTATLDRHGLDRLVAGYGMDMLNEAILDFGVPLQFQTPNQAGTPIAFQAPGILMVGDAGAPDHVDTSFAPFFRQDILVFPYASPLVLRPERQPAAKQRVVARSSDKATLDGRPIKTMLPSNQIWPTGVGEERNIAVAVEGTLSTAFPGGDDLGIHVASKSPAPSRVLVVASSQFFANPFVYSSRLPPSVPPQMAGIDSSTLAQLGSHYAQGNATRMLFAFKSSLAWLASDEDEAELAASLKPVVRKNVPAPPASSSAPSAAPRTPFP